MGTRRNSQNRRAQGEGTVYRYGDQWMAKAVAGHDAKGRRKYRSKLCATKGEAVVALAQLRREIDSGIVATPKLATLGELLEAWLTVKGQEIRPTTLAQYSWASKHLTEKLGTKRLRDLSTPDVDRYLASLELSAESKRLIRTVLRAALSYAESTNLIERNVAARSRAVKAGEKVGRAMSEAELARFLKACESDSRGDLWLAFLLTGARRGEVLALKWSNVSDTTLTIAETITYLPGQGVMFGPTKSGRARTIPLGDELQALLARQRGRQVAKAAELLGEGVRVDYPLVFCTDLGSPLDPNNVGKAWRAFAARHQLGVRLHDLRHTTATLLLRRGVGIPEVQRWLGHASITITSDVYGHVGTDDLRPAASVLDTITAARN